MTKYFGINIEFDNQVIHNIIGDTIFNNSKGYVCSVDGNNFSKAQVDPAFLDLLNNGVVNNCDSAWLPVILNSIHRTNFRNYPTPDLFDKLIKSKLYKHMFLGASRDVLDDLKRHLVKIDTKIQGMLFVELPFCSVQEFDYDSIAKTVNQDNPDIVWISLGAPKQEIFMSMLEPKLSRGVLIGCGAAFNYYAMTPGLERAPNYLVKLKLEWLYRMTQEPVKQLRRAIQFIKVLPVAIYREFNMTKF